MSREGLAATSRTRYLEATLTYLLVAAALMLLLFPFLWMLSTALKPVTETFAVPPRWLPEKPTLEAFIKIWQIRPFGHYLLNSLIVAFGTTALCLVCAALAGYAYARFTFKGSKATLFILLITQMFPYVMLATPIYVSFVRLHLLDTHLGLILADTTIALPFSVWMLRSYFVTIPKGLEEAAMIDGCSRLSAFVRVILPLSAPGLFATAVYCFLLVWGEFLFAVTLTSSDVMRTVTVGLYSFVGQFLIEWNYLMAAITVVTIPVVVLFIWSQRYLVSGLVSGAVKE